MGGDVVGRLTRGRHTDLSSHGASEKLEPTVAGRGERLDGPRDGEGEEEGGGRRRHWEKSLTFILRLNTGSFRRRTCVHHHAKCQLPTRVGSKFDVAMLGQ